MTDAGLTEVLHATSVAFGPMRGALLLGPSGSGKSSLALSLLALGADLVADDRTCLTMTGNTITLTRPPGLPPLIEARGIGLLPAPTCAQARLMLVIDLGSREDTRLPPARTWAFHHIPVPLLHISAQTDFPAAIRLYLMHMTPPAPRTHP